MRLITTLLLFSINLIGLAQSVKTADPNSLKFNVQDVVNFWSAYDQLATTNSYSDSLQVVEKYYVSKASQGLKLYNEMSNSDAKSFLTVIRIHPKLLRSIRANSLAISTRKDSILEGVRKLKRAYPASVFPELFFCMGKFEVKGNRTDDILYIGAELNSLAKESPRDEITNSFVRAAAGNFDELDAVCLHEIAHFQQQLIPKTNLEFALTEGGAEFVTHILTGKSTMQSVFDKVDASLEKTIWREFALQKDKPIDAIWFLAMGDEKQKRPGMLGYVIGFRICENYYKKAKDKEEALRNIISLSKPQTIIQASGY